MGIKDTVRGVGGRGIAARRIVLGIAAVAIWLGVASLIKPAPRKAAADDQQSSRLRAPSREVRTQAEFWAQQRGWTLIGSLEGTEFTVLIHASPDGPLYSVFTLDGRPIQTDLPADEVYRAFPDLDIEGMRLDPADDGPVPIMLADPID